MPILINKQFLYLYLKAIAKPPLVVGLVSLLMGTIITGRILDDWIRGKLPSELEQKISQVIRRPIKISGIKEYSLTQLTLGPCFLPTTKYDHTQLQARSLIIDINPWQILHRGTLKATITFDGLKANLPANFKPGLTNFSINSLQLPLPLDVTFKTKKGLIQWQNQTAIAVTGQLRYLQAPKIHWQYQAKLQGQDLDLALAGETFNQDLRSQLSLEIKKLSLAKAKEILPTTTLKITEKNLLTNLAILIVNRQSLATNLGITPNDLSSLNNSSQGLTEALKINLNIKLQKQQLIFDQSQLSWGKISANLTGNYDWIKGFNLNSEVRIGDVGELANIVTSFSPHFLPINQKFYPSLSLDKNFDPYSLIKGGKKENILGINRGSNIKGSLVAQFKLRGTWNQPWLLGNLKSQQPLEVNGIKLQKLETYFNSDFNRFNLSLLNLKMENGDYLFSRGYWDSQFLNQLKSQQGLKPWQQSKIQLTLQAEVNPNYHLEKFLPSYAQIAVKPLAIKSEINGQLGNPQARLQWRSLSLACTTGSCFVNQTRNVNSLSSSGALELQKQKLSFNSKINQPQQGEIILTGRANFSRSQWQLDSKINKFIFTPYLTHICKDIVLVCDLHPQLSTGQAQASGAFTGFLPIINQAQSALKLQIQSGQEKGEFFSYAQLNKQQIDTNIRWQNLPRSLISLNLPKQWQVKQGLLQVSLPIKALQQGQNFNANYLQASLLSQLQLGQALGQVRGELKSGKLQVKGIIPQQLTISKSLLNLPLPVALERTAFQFNYAFNSPFKPFGQVNLISQPQTSKSGEREGFLKDFTFSIINNLTGQIKTQVILNRNHLVTTVNLQNQNWTAQVKSSRISLKEFLILDAQGQKLNQNLQAIAPYFNPTLTDPALNLILSGNLQNILNSEKTIPIQADHLWLKSKNYGLLATGKMSVTKSLIKPDLDAVNLSVQAQSNLIKLNFNSLLDRLPVERSLLPQDLQTQSQLNFRGNFIGQKLLTQPWQDNNIKLRGKLNLNQLQVDRYAFEPQLTGQLAIAAGDSLTLDLRGKEDRLATVWRFNAHNLCLMGYLPESLIIKQQRERKIPLILIGKASENHFLTKIESFPLDLLELAWLSNFGIQNYLDVKVKGNFDWNWQQKTAKGTLTFAPPDRFWWDQQPANLKTDFSYQNNFIQLSQTNLFLDRNYAITDASLNLRSGALTGQLSIADGHIQSILKALPNLLPTESKPVILDGIANINPQPATISTQLNNLWQVDNRVRQAFEIAQKSLPKTLDLEGRFIAKVTLSGNLESPQLDFKLQGKRWIWQTQPPQPTLISPLGLVLTTNQVIPIEDLSVQANLSPQAFNLKSQLQTSGSNLEGQLALRTSEKGLYLEPSRLAIKNFSLDTAQNWVKFPWDISGQVSLDINLAGALIKPQLTGKFDLQNLAWNGQLLRQDIAGKVTYQNQTFSLQTSKPDAIQLLANISLPSAEKSVFPFVIEANLQTEALALIENLTSNTKEQRGDRFNIEWKEGEGELQLKTRGTVSLGNPLQLTLDPKSELHLSLAKVSLKTPLLSQLLDFNGQITLKDNYFIFENFTSQIGQETVTSEGKLPLFPPAPGTAILNNPLTLTFSQKKEERDRRYQGELDGQIQITGSALNPVIGGNIALKNGVLSVPDRLPERTQPTPVSLQWFGQKENSLKTLFIKPPELQNFQINLENVQLNQHQKRPYFAFNISGNLALDGFLDNLYSLKPSGTIDVNQGSVNFAPSSVFIDQHQINQISFFPNQGLFNPTVNLNLQLYLLSLKLINLKNNAIPDDLVQSWHSQSFLLHIGIQGEAAQLLPQLSQFQSDRCSLFSQNEVPFPNRVAFPNLELYQYSRCLNSRFLDIETLEDLIRSPLVSITSTPLLTRSQYLVLFANQYDDFANNFPEQNEQPFIQAGFAQIGATLAPSIQDLIFNTNMQFISWGNAIGLDTLQVYPTLSTQYRIEHNAVIKMDYDYTLNQGKIQYQRQF